MNTLILKLNATGDVVRTTPVLRRMNGHVTWVTASLNLELLQGVAPDLRVLDWGGRQAADDQVYDLLINLEDEPEVAHFARSIRHRDCYGARLDSDGTVSYSTASSGWFDLSLISRHGRTQADGLKFANRRSYQDLIFEGLGWAFSGERYLLPPPCSTGLTGDVAMAPFAGPVWPMKNWPFYEQLKSNLEASGAVVNVLPRRGTLREHLGDIVGHRCLVSGDSLPMHLALGMGIRCVSLFTCTSPWEIYDYGVQTKVVSPLLGEFFYKRGNDRRATEAISIEEVERAVRLALGS